jgi:hypothetical protein
MKASGHGTEAKTLAVHDKYGLNKFDVPVPAFGALLKDHLVAPFFVFQVSGTGSVYIEVALFTVQLSDALHCTVK